VSTIVGRSRQSAGTTSPTNLASRCKELVQAESATPEKSITAHHIVRRTTDRKVQSLAQLIFDHCPTTPLLLDDL
jgi:hypothetical protein